jgi:peptide/nickel transport system ATP-binding protein
VSTNVPNNAPTDVLLSVENLTITLPKKEGAVNLVHDVSFSIRRGETLGLVGESGSGKSLTALSLLRLVPEPLKIASGKLLLDGQNLLSLSETQMRAVRGKRIAMIFQDPMTSLNPVFTVGEQIAESVRVHKNLAGQAAWQAAIEALRRVKIPDAERRAKQYPYELSGGMRQRVMIAMALASEPDVLLADEPTTALDVTVQAQILALIRELQREMGMAVLFITHDLGVVAEICDRVIVLYGGQVMEEADATTLFQNAKHPYTQGLLRSLPEATPKSTRHLPFIPGQPPVPGTLVGCPFAPRCPQKLDDGVCERALPTQAFSLTHTAHCHQLEGDHR